MSISQIRREGHRTAIGLGEKKIKLGKHHCGGPYTIAAWYENANTSKRMKPQKGRLRVKK